MGYFNPPAPCGAGPTCREPGQTPDDFNPPAPCGAGRVCPPSSPWRWNFNPPAPCGAGRSRLSGWATPSYFNPPAPCGAGLQRTLRYAKTKEISIHPPLAGRDCRTWYHLLSQLISIHPPLAGRDLMFLGILCPDTNFNPPAPCGAGPAAHSPPASPPNFNPPAPCGAGQRSCTKKTVQNIAYCTKSAFTLAVLSGFPALMRPFFLPNVHKFRCEPSEESLLAPRSHAYTIRTPSG